MRFTTRYISGAAALLLGAALTPASGMSLHEAAQQALQNDPRLVAAGSAVQAASAGVDAASAGWKPNASFAAGVGYQRYGFQSSPTPGFPLPSKLLPASATLKASQTLYSGGLISAQVHSSREQLEGARQNREATQQALLLAAVSAYVDVVRDRTVLQLEEANVQTLAQAESDTQKRFDAGAATRTDTAQAAARLAEAQANRKRAQTALAASDASFLRVVGVPAPESLSTDWPNPLVPASLNAALAMVDATPSVQAADARQRAAVADVDAARSGYKPSLALSGQATEQNDSEFGLDSYHTWKVQLQATMPIYQGGAVDAKVSQARAGVQQAQAEALDARRASVEDITQAWSALQSADEVIHAYEAAVAANQMALDNTRKELAVGTRTTLDLLDAERDSVGSQVNLTASRRDRAVAVYQLLAACGSLHLEDVR
jgi:outer membrane protein